MKIEIGESLCYSWLRHVKDCQIVQTNWKPSPSWQLLEEDSLDNFMQISGKHFATYYGFDVYKKNRSLVQLLRQAEVDALGISVAEEGTKLYAVDVAYHESGLNYSNRAETVERIAKKFLRTAMCLRGYFEINDGELIFASPKINGSVLNDIVPIMTDLNFLLEKYGFGFKARLIANDDFDEKILKPIITASDGVADTSELFMRAYQLTKMFGNCRTMPSQVATPSAQASGDAGVSIESLRELKVGKIAQTVLREFLANGGSSPEEITMMQTREYSNCWTLRAEKQVGSRDIMLNR